MSRRRASPTQSQRQGSLETTPHKTLRRFTSYSLGGTAEMISPRVLATLTVLVVSCSPFAGAAAQTWEQMIVPYRVPSPSGIATVAKQYIPSGPWYYRLSTAGYGQANDAAPVDLLGGGSPGGVLGGDGLVAGWNGDDHLIIGTPIGQPVVAGPDHVGAVTVAYINYEPDLTKTAGQRIDRVTLQHVSHMSQEVENVHHNIDRTIHISGTDGTFFDKVDVEIIGHGAGVRRIQGTVGGGAVSIKLSLARLQGTRSPLLTPTQAIFGGVDPIIYPGAIRGPLQEGMSLRYTAFDFPQTSKLFDALRDGGYSIRFCLTFGEQEITYFVQAPITIEAATTYQKCEARTNIYWKLVGNLLSRP